MLPSRLQIRFEEGDWDDCAVLYTYSIKKNFFFKRNKIDLMYCSVSLLPKGANLEKIKEFLYQKFILDRKSTLMIRKLKKLK